MSSSGSGSSGNVIAGCGLVVAVIGVLIALAQWLHPFAASDPAPFQNAPTTVVSGSGDDTGGFTFPTSAPVDPISSGNTPTVCPYMVNGFTMYINVTYGPFNGYWLSFGPGGEFYVTYPNGSVTTYPRISARNTWLNLNGSIFSVCVDSAGYVYGLAH